MKKIGLLLAVCVVAAIGVLLITHYYTHTTGDIISKKSGPLKVDLPEAAKKGQPEEGAAPLDDEIADALDAKLVSDAGRAVYDVELAKIKEKIQQINKPFTDVKFEEVPAEFRLKMLPPKGAVSHGRLISYDTDEADNLILVDGRLRVTDYGPLSSSIAYDGEGSFKQTITFPEKADFYYKSFKHSEVWVNAMTFQWDQTGTQKNIPTANDEREWGTFFNLDSFYSKKLSKGDTVSTVLDGKYNATVEVLGYAEIEGHKTVAFEQRIPDCPQYEEQGVPPYKREVSRRIYLDIETNMPLRAEGRTVSKFDDPKKFPQIVGIPQSGIKQSAYIYQIDL